MKVSALPFALFCMLLVAPLAQASPYVDLIDYPRQEPNWDRFFALEGRLQYGFDAICGDTFCEGEYSDIRARACAARWTRYAARCMSACGHLPPVTWLCRGMTVRSSPGNRPGCAACRWCLAHRWRPSMPRSPPAIHCMTRCRGPRRASMTG